MNEPKKSTNGPIGYEDVDEGSAWRSSEATSTANVIPGTSEAAADRDRNARRGEEEGENTNWAHEKGGEPPQEETRRAEHTPEHPDQGVHDSGGHGQAIGQRQADERLSDGRGRRKKRAA